MIPYSGDLIELAIRGTVILAIGHLLSKLFYRQSASFRGMLMTLCLLSLLALPLAWISLPKWEALPQQMTVMPYFPVQLPAVDQSELVKIAEQNIIAGKTPAQSTQWPSWNIVICRAWQVGLILSLCPLVLGWLMLRRIQHQAQPVTDANWHDLLSISMRQLNLSRRIWLLQSTKHTMPMTWGWLRSYILIPSEADTWPEGKRQAMLLHELAHIKRRDCLLAGLCQFACAMHWFNPLAWWALVKLRSLREEACDNIVLGVMEQAKASDYAQHLLDIAANLHSPVLANHASIAMARKSSLENRLLAILDPRKHRGSVTRRLMLASVILVIACVIPLTILRAGESSKPQEAQNPASTPVNPNGFTVMEKNPFNTYLDKPGSNVPAFDFKDGVVVELLGLRESSSDHPQWWKPNGEPLENAPYDQMKGKLQSEGNPFEIAFSVERPLGSDVSLFVHEAGSSSNSEVTKNGKALRNICALKFAVPKEQKTITVGIKIASGSWSTIQDIKGTNASALAGTNPFDNITLTDTFVHGDGVRLTASVEIDPVQPVEVRLLLVEDNGRTHQPSQRQSLSAGNTQQITCEFSNIKIDQIRGYKYQIRGFKKMVYAGVSLKQGGYTDPELVSVQNEPHIPTRPQIYNRKISEQRMRRGRFSIQSDQLSPVPISVPIVSTSIQHSRSITEDKRLKQRFDEIYCLNRGELMRFIPEPIIPERNAYLQMLDQHFDVKTNEKRHCIFHMVKGEVEKKVTYVPGTIHLPSFIDAILFVRPYDLIIDEKVKDIKIAGDWVIRPDASLVERRDAFVEILNQLGYPIQIQGQSIQRDVIIVTGEYHYHPANGYENNRLHLTYDNISTEKSPIITYGFDYMIDQLGGFLHTKFINKAVFPEDVVISYNLLPCGDFNDEQNKQKLLDYLAKQTNLTFTHQKRTLYTQIVSIKE